MQECNEYGLALSTDKSLLVQVSEDMSGVSECADTRLAFDTSRDIAALYYRLMNENNSERVLSSINKFVQLIEG